MDNSSIISGKSNMELSNAKHANYEVDLAEAQSHVWNHALHYIHSMTLKCAIQLDIPDIINNHGRPMKLSELVSALSIHPDRSNFIQRLMRILVHSGFFALRKIGEEGGQEEDEGYVLTLASSTLLKENKLNISPMMLFISDPILMDPFHHLRKWLYHDNIPTAFMEKNKTGIWEFAGQDPDSNRVINEAMACDTPVVADVIINKCKATFEGAKLLVDVGGGTGGLARAVAEKFPNLDCTVLDLPHVVSGIKGAQNLSFVGGDMFVAIPPADVILLKWILHDWNDEKCLTILKHCKEAISGKGKNVGNKVIIVDMVIENRNLKTESFSETELLLDLLMMVNLDGKERNEDDWARLFCNAGFSGYNIIPIVGSRSIIEVFP